MKFHLGISLLFFFFFLFLLPGIVGNQKGFCSTDGHATLSGIQAPVEPRLGPHLRSIQVLRRRSIFLPRKLLICSDSPWDVRLTDIFCL